MAVRKKKSTTKKCNSYYTNLDFQMRNSKYIENFQRHVFGNLLLWRNCSNFKKATKANSNGDDEKKNLH